MAKQYLNVQEVGEALGVSQSKAYSIIRVLNAELQADGYITMQGKVNRIYFEKRCLYGGKVSGE
jgi:hypothetical protein